MAGRVGLPGAMTGGTGVGGALEDGDPAGLAGVCVAPAGGDVAGLPLVAGPLHPASSAAVSPTARRPQQPTRDTVRGQPGPRRVAATRATPSGRTPVTVVLLGSPAYALAGHWLV